MALKQRSNGPWIMAFLALAGAAGGGYWLHQGRQTRPPGRGGGDAEARRPPKEEKTELAQKVEKLEAEKTELANEKEELSKDVQAKAGELAALERHVRQASRKR